MLASHNEVLRGSLGHRNTPAVQFCSRKQDTYEWPYSQIHPAVHHILAAESSVFHCVPEGAEDDLVLPH